jgi:hypothetical protein
MEGKQPCQVKNVQIRGTHTAPRGHVVVCMLEGTHVRCPPPTEDQGYSARVQLYAVQGVCNVSGKGGYLARKAADC